MTITATHINYYFVCHRKLWLFSNGINMEHTSDIVYEGKLLHENSYEQRPQNRQEMMLSATYNNIELFGRVDFYDSKNKIIHEIKKSDKVETAHQWQVKYYIWLFQLSGIQDVKGIIEYPKLRKTETVELSEIDITELQQCVTEIGKIIENPECPPVIHSRICKSCSYYEFCYVRE